jgi:hypothetical protein
MKGTNGKKGNRINIPYLALFAQYYEYYSYQMKLDEMSRSCGTRGSNE